MKLLVINPDSGLSEEQLSQRVACLKTVARQDTEILMECLTNTNVCIDSLCDVAVAAPEIIQKTIHAEKRGFDAVGIYCLSDPALEACREAVEIPVLGGGQSSLQVAAGLGFGFSILTTSARRIPEKYRFVSSSCIDTTLLKSVRSVEYDILANRDISKDLIENRLFEMAARCIAEDGAQVIVLGCLSFAGMGARLTERLGVPVVDPAFTLIGMAELLVSQKLSHSKLTFPRPPARVREWGGGVFDVN